MSDRARGRPRFPEDLEVDHLGISMFASAAQARSMMRRYPKVIATVRLEPEHGLSLARTLPDIDGHYSVWGLPEDLLGLVESVAVDNGP